MVRYGNLYNKITSFENLYLASRKARRGKRDKGCVIRFESNIEEELLHLQNELINRTYTPGKYLEFTIYERKPRKISAAPYRDRVVHHALCNVIEPIYEKLFIYDSYACRKDKGTHKAVNKFTEFARKNDYIFKCDIMKYFPSIDHEILFRKIKKKIKCKNTLWLIKTIIDHSNPQEEVNYYFKGDDLFEPFRRKKGIPIGNLTSQFFANVYLNDIDHYIKEALKCRYYIRYVDDMAIFDDSKERLWEISKKIKKYIYKERLRLHPKKLLVTPVSVGIDHLGYRIYPTHRLLRKDNSIRFRRKIKTMRTLYINGLMEWETINSFIQSWIGHARHANTYRLRRSFFRLVSFKRQEISEYHR